VMHDLPTTVTSCLPFEAIDRMLDLGSGAFKVWVYFWRHADADGRIAASLSCIAAGVHMSIEAVRRSTAELETKKRICCKREGSGPRATTYELVLLESSRSGNSSNRVDQAENYSNRVDQELLESPPSSTRIEEIFGDSEPESSRARVDQDSLFKETPKEESKERKNEVLRTSAPAAPDADPTEAAKAALWEEGVPILSRLRKPSDPSAGSIVGRLLKVAQHDYEAVLDAVREAEKKPPLHLLSWLTRVIQNRVDPLPKPAYDPSKFSGAVALSFELEMEARRRQECPA